LWLEAAFLVLGILAVLLEAKSKVDHGQSGADLLIFAAVLCLPIVAALATSAVLALRGTSWIWWLAGALQIFFAFVGVIVVIAGGIAMLPYVAVPAAILWLLATRDSASKRSKAG
jgi:hypothetical protein